MDLISYKRYLCIKTIKNQISSAYKAGIDKLKNQLLQLENISLILNA
jgi:hypothetical protein